MPDDNSLPRSPERMSADDTALLVIDVQEKLIDLLPDHEAIVWNVARLIDAAGILSVPIAATEQYPKGLGRTVEALTSRLKVRPSEKVTFSCGSCGEIFSALDRNDVSRVAVCGIETHVCVQQTVLDLLAAGFRVYVAADAVGARRDIDHQVALRRMEASGATLTTTEAILFEWCERAGTPNFKSISQLVRQSPPHS
jgi:nicotinamidase-related amidase